MAVSKEDIIRIDEEFEKLEQTLIQNQREMTRIIVANQKTLLASMKVLRGYLELLVKD